MDQKITHTIKHVPKTRYSLDNQKALPMSKFVPAFISQYVNENPLKYKELKRIFNDDLIEKSHRQIGVLCTKKEYEEWDVSSKTGRYFIGNGVLRSSDGIEFYINAQWTQATIPGILELAKSLGYKIVDDSMTDASESDNVIAIYELPTNYDINWGLHKNLLNAILEYADILEKYLENSNYIKTKHQIKSYTLSALILKLYYGKGMGIEEIANIHGCTRQNIEITKSKTIAEILSGDVFFGKYKLHQSLYDVMQSLKSEYLFSTLKQFETYAGESDDALFAAMKLDTFTITNNRDNTETTIIIPIDTKILYTSIWNVIKEVLQENPLPTDRGAIEELIQERIAEEKKINDRLSDKEEASLFIERMLDCEDLIEKKENNHIQIKYDYLSSASQRIARIVYERTAQGENSRITTKEIEKLYFSLHPKCKQLNISSARTFGIYCEGKSGKWYYGEPKTPIHQKIREYAEENIIFYYKDIEEYIQKNGYTILQALRVYITNVCFVDKNDSNHFCHKDYADEHEGFEWKSQQKYGWTNWIYNEIKNILGEKESFPIAKLVEELETRCQDTEYSGIRKRFFYYITTYCNDDKPFTIKDDNIVVNHNVYDSTDFEIIGLRGDKYAFYKQIRSLVANETKKAENSKITLVDIISLVNQNIDPTIRRGTIIKAIEDKNKRFVPINVELVNEDGTIYAKWIGQNTPVEPIYVISTADDNPETQDIIEVKNQPEERPEIKYRQQVSWSGLCTAIKKELIFYSKWMSYDNIIFDDAVEDFIDFIKSSRNHNLNTQLPLDLYEYWYASTDSNDRYRYLRDILIMFEGLLGEMYYLKHGEACKKYGLIELTKEFKGLTNLFLYSRESKGFNKIACSLLRNRNIVAHGGYLETNSATMAKYITDYIALYIYTFAMYKK
jgi:hypothetical protein